MSAQILLLGERDLPLGPTVRVTGTWFPPIPDVPPEVENSTLVKAIWELGVRHLGDLMAKGLRLTADGDLIPANPHAKAAERHAATAAKVKTLIPARRPKKVDPTKPRLGRGRKNIPGGV